MKQYALLTAALLSGCALSQEPEIKIPVVDLNTDEYIKIVERKNSADKEVKEISAEEKVEAILKEFRQPGDYRIDGIDLSSGTLNVEMYFDICDKKLRFAYCENGLSLMINISDNDLESEIFLVDSPPYGSLDYFDLCKGRICKIRPTGYQEIGTELLKRIVDKGYKQVIDDNKNYFIDSKVEAMFNHLTNF